MNKIYFDKAGGLLDVMHISCVTGQAQQLTKYFCYGITWPDGEHSDWLLIFPGKSFLY